MNKFEIYYINYKVRIINMLNYLKLNLSFLCPCFIISKIEQNEEPDQDQDDDSIDDFITVPPLTDKEKFHDIV